jgi:hypothetical protein
MTETLVDVSIYPEVEQISYPFGGTIGYETRSEKFWNTVVRAGKYRRKIPTNFAYGEDQKYMMSETRELVYAEIRNDIGRLEQRE